METLAASLMAFIAVITIPIGILNFAGGIVAGIWLLIVGKWTLVLSALISTVVSTWILGLLMAPTLLFMAPLASERLQKMKPLVFILGAVSNLWTYGLMLLYGVGSFIFVFNNYESGMTLPYLLLAYAVATAPWTYMASQENRSNEGAGIGTTVPVFGICIASIAMMGNVFLYGSPTFTGLAIVAAVPLGLTWAIQMAIIFFTLKEAKATD